MIIVIFVLLQAMDALTTVAFLNMGIREANPLIRLVLANAVGCPPAQMLALAVPKLFAVGLGAFAWYSGRKRVLLLMNILFSLCVAWNAVVILGTLR
jgi:hypothetical protein